LSLPIRFPVSRDSVTICLLHEFEWTENGGLESLFLAWTVVRRNDQTPVDRALVAPN
jgi:hypothetical protein